MKKKKLMDVEDIRFYASCILEEDMFFFTEKENIFMKMDMRSFKTEIIYFDDKVKENSGGNLPVFMLSKGNSIYKLQHDGEKLIEYEIETGEVFNYEIGEKGKLWGNFCCVSAYGNYLYLFPGYSSEIIKIDLLNRKIVEKKNILEINSNLGNLDKDCLYWEKGYKISGKKIALFTRKRRDVLIYNLEKDDYEINFMPEEMEGIVDICSTEEGIYVLSSHNSLYLWNYKDSILKLLTHVPEIRDKNYFGEMISTTEKIIVLPCLGDDIYIYNKQKNTFTIYKNYPADFGYNGYTTAWSKYNNMCESKEYVYYPMRLSNYILQIEKNKGSIKWIKPNPPSKLQRCIYYNQKGISILDERNIGLSTYIDFIKNKL